MMLEMMKIKIMVRKMVMMIVRMMETAHESVPRCFDLSKIDEIYVQRKDRSNHNRKVISVPDSTANGLKAV